jgi:hypothetical protein
MEVATANGGKPPWLISNDGQRMSEFSTVQISALADLPKALLEASSVTNSRVLPLQAEAKKEWDHIRVEIWEDSGRVIIFPASSASQRRIDAAGVQIVCTELAGRIDALSSSDIGDDAYTEEVKKEVAGLVSAVRNSLPHHLPYPIWCID